MTTHSRARTSLHDQVVRGAQEIYERHGRKVWVNPGQQKNKAWCGQYIDVIAVGHVNDTEAWVIEVETEESVTDAEASTQWSSYDNAFAQGRWYIAVPRNKMQLAQSLVKLHGLRRVSVITWARNAKGGISFWGLPGLKY